MDATYVRSYRELKALAHRVRAGRAGDTLSTTALVNETWLKLAGRAPAWRDHEHFLAIAARAMRQVLVDAARHRLAAKRGGGAGAAITLDDEVQAAPVRDAVLVALDDALTRLAAVEPRRALVVEHRFFGGLSIPETARAMGLGSATVERDWRVARAWLASELGGTTGGAPGATDGEE
jgi:RNA polymerase sigma factor (TIGR02999 family)